MDPKDAVVSIWLEGGATPIGSGAFISPRFVLTARHVVEGTEKEKLRVGTIDGLAERARCRDVLIHPDFSADIALIELFEGSGGQGFNRISEGRELENQSVRLYAASPTNGNRDSIGDYPVSLFSQEKLVYFFPHQQRLGHSGGIAVHGGAIVGVISQRHETENQGTFVPLHLVWDWLAGFASAANPAISGPGSAVIADSTSECGVSHSWVANIINRNAQVSAIYDMACGHAASPGCWSVFSIAAEERHWPRALAGNLYYAITDAQPEEGDCIELPIRGRAKDKFRRSLIPKVSRLQTSPPGAELPASEAQSILEWMAQARNGLRVVYVPLTASEKDHRWCEVLSGAIETLRQLDDYIAQQAVGQARGRLVVLFGCIPDAEKKPWFKSLFNRAAQPALPAGCVQLDPLELLKQAHIVEWRDGLLMSVSHELSKLGDAVCDQLFPSEQHRQTYKDVYRFIEKRLSPEPAQRDSQAPEASHKETYL